MSATAPWIALSIDWHESDMFDEEATDGERLAWICLLCHAKAYGRGGRVRVRKSALAATYRLSMRAVEGMLARAQKCGSITIDEEAVTIANWGVYQWKAARSGGSVPEEKPEKRKKSPTNVLSCPVSVPASSSSDSSSEGGCKGETIPPVLDTTAFRDAWSEFVAHRKDIKKPLTDRSRSMQLKSLEAMGHDRAIAAIHHTIANGWTGIFEPKSGAGGPASANGVGDHGRADRSRTEFAQPVPRPKVRTFTGGGIGAGGGGGTGGGPPAGLPAANVPVESVSGQRSPEDAR